MIRHTPNQLCQLTKLQRVSQEKATTEIKNELEITKRNCR